MSPFGGDNAAAETTARHPERLVAAAQRGDGAARERLIRAFTPYVMRVASQVAGRYLQPGRDEEISIALLAFNEAIGSFEASRGTGFLSFAETVMRRRLIDYFRRETGRRREIPMSGFEETDDEGNVQNPIEGLHATEAFSHQEEVAERAEEILRYRELLAGYGISLVELVRLAPRHEDARRRAIAAARRVAADPVRLRYLREKKELPLKALQQEVAVSRKTLERQRKYIIAIALALSEDFFYLPEYLRKASEPDE